MTYAPDPILSIQNFQSSCDPQLTDDIKALIDDVPYSRGIISRMVIQQQGFWSFTSHELQSLLSVIRSSLRCLETSHPEVRTYHYWNDIFSGCICLEALLKDLSDFGASGHLFLQRADLQVLLRNTCRSCQALVEGTGKTLTFTSMTKGPCLMMDVEKMKTAVINIIRNAVDAVNEHGEVSLQLSRTDSCAIIQISDNGCGIPADRLLSVFQPFVTTKPNGTGLGLPVARHIIESHKGHVQISSAPGIGTTFTFTLPLSIF